MSDIILIIILGLITTWLFSYIIKVKKISETFGQILTLIYICFGILYFICIVIITIEIFTMPVIYIICGLIWISCGIFASIYSSKEIVKYLIKNGKMNEDVVKFAYAMNIIFVIYCPISVILEVLFKFILTKNIFYNIYKQGEIEQKKGNK